MSIQFSDGLDWRVDAACLTFSSEWWFPDSQGAGVYRAAKRICADCPVKQECLTVALENHEQYGLWGGLSERERRGLGRAHGIRGAA